MTFWNGLAAASMKYLGTSLNIASGNAIVTFFNTGGAGGGFWALTPPARTTRAKLIESPHTRTTASPLCVVTDTWETDRTVDPTRIGSVFVRAIPGDPGATGVDGEHPGFGGDRALRARPRPCIQRDTTNPVSRTRVSQYPVSVPGRQA